jgi:integrase
LSTSTVSEARLHVRNFNGAQGSTETKFNFTQPTIAINVGIELGQSSDRAGVFFRLGDIGRNVPFAYKQTMLSHYRIKHRCLRNIERNGIRRLFDPQPSTIFEDRTDRHGNDRLYVRRNGRRIRPREKLGTDKFAKAYAQALEALATPAPTDERPSPIKAIKGTLGWTAVKYYASDEFDSLDPESQATRRRVIDSCLDEPHTDNDPDPIRNCPIQFVTSKKIKRLRDLKALKGLPGAANNRRKYLSAMFGWAIEAEHMKSNPARDVRRKKYATNGFYTWTLSDLTAFENRHPIGSKARLALSLLLFLGLRKGDMVGVGEKNIHDALRDPLQEAPGEAVRRVIKFIPNKTRYQRLIESEKPILPVLEAILAASPCGTEAFLETEFGKPFTAGGFGNWFRDRCDEAGLTKCSAHGLRKIGATMCAERGASEHQLMAIFDWSTPQQAATYTRAALRRKLAASSMHMLGPSGGVH